MTYISPTREERREAAADAMAASIIATNTKLADVLREARAKAALIVAGAEHDYSMAPGYDLADLISTLDEITPRLGRDDVEQVNDFCGWEVEAA